jgi:GTP-binding protein Era
MDPSTAGFSFMENEPKPFRCGYVAIVGEPNVGKSTLLNAMLQEKLSIVTKKPQTTRQRVLGILSVDAYQMIFLDTPGLMKPKYKLHEEMLRHAESALNDADVILVMTEASRGASLPPQVESRVHPLVGKKPIVLVINKVDTVYKPTLLPAMDGFIKMALFSDVIPISALKKDNLAGLEKTLASYLPIHEPLYPTDIISQQPERFFVAELIREQVFAKFRQEVPYATAVEIREFKDREGGKAFISADIVVERDSQKGILIGNKGEALQRIGSSSRREIEAFLQRSVYLELHVKVRENWREDDNMLRSFGYRAEK